MTLRARIVRAPLSNGAKALFALRPSATQMRRIAREELESRLTAERVAEEARSQANAIVARAREEANGAAAEIAREAREEAEARVAAQWLALRQGESARLVQGSDKIVAVAVALAERLLGAALDLRPELIAQLARVAIDEARGAQRIAIEAHPLDVELLRQSLRDAHLEHQLVEIRANEALARGDLRLKTDVGTIDAKLSTRLDRLAIALRDPLP